MRIQDAGVQVSRVHIHRQAPARPALIFCLKELADNAIRHSGAGGGLCLLEYSDDRLHVVIRDRGVGIHHRMREAYGVLGESTAVRWAFGGVAT